MTIKGLILIGKGKMLMISVYNLTKEIRQAKKQITVFRNLNCAINSGEFVAIYGPVGSGKSSVIQVLGMLESPSYGKYVFEQNDISIMTEDEMIKFRSNKIGLVFSSPLLIPHLSILENIELPLVYSGMESADRESRVLSIADTLEIVDILSSRTEEITFFQKILVSFARALVTSPRVLIMDEPTSGLGSLEAEEILQLIQKLNREGLTVILGTQDFDTAKHAKRVFVMKDGELSKDVIVSEPINAIEVLKNLKKEDINKRGGEHDGI